MGVHGLILAGGQGLRLGGTDKARLVVDGQSLLSIAVQRLSPQVSSLAISANGDVARFSDIGVPTVTDPDNRQLGPMSGVLAGLDWLSEIGGRFLVTVAVDTPFFPDDLVARLAGPDPSSDHFALAASAGRLHPTFGFWPIGLRPALRQALEEGERRIGKWSLMHGAVRVDFPDATPDPFFNINTPEDLMVAQGFLAR